jgi:hypothetical protein
MKKLVFVSSPLSGDFVNNVRRAEEYCGLVAREGHIPFAPHVYFTQFLDDENPEERELGMSMGLEVLERCDELWVFPVNGVISQGMTVEIRLAKQLRKPIYFRHLPEEDDGRH